MVRRRRKRVARDVIERPEVVGVVCVGSMMGVGLPATSLAVLGGALAATGAEVSMSDDVTQFETRDQAGA